MKTVHSNLLSDIAKVDYLESNKRKNTPINAIICQRISVYVQQIAK